MDRNIPHIRDIFSSSRKKSGDFQDLCVYEKSPRSRRRGKGFEATPEHEHSDGKNSSSSPRKRNEKGKENQKTKSSDEARLLPEHNKNNSNNSAYANKQYSSKTLTERDIRHLERHLSMKKTIRKQISRNLAQAFVDNPNLFEPKRESGKPDYGATISKAKLAKSEQNVLDMLKISIDDRDSGHSSPTNEVLSREDEDDECEANYDGLSEPKGWSNGHRNSETKLLNSDADSKPYNSDKKSIWKMFSSRNKGKR